jgi:hypothetical protein
MEGCVWRATSRILGMSNHFVACDLGTTLMQPLSNGAVGKLEPEVTRMKRAVETVHGPTGAAEEAI